MTFPSFGPSKDLKEKILVFLVHLCASYKTTDFLFCFHLQNCVGFFLLYKTLSLRGQCHWVFTKWSTMLLIVSLNISYIPSSSTIQGS